MEVEVLEEASASSSGGAQHPGDPTAQLVNNTPVYPQTDGPVVIVRVEEVLLVALVLMIWVAAIALFFNRWGKIRMLEPYQPKFSQEAHRPSCPLAPLSPPLINTQVSHSNTLPRTQKPSTHRMSFSKYNVNALTDPLSVLPSPIIRRQRQNSVFVGSSTMAILNPPPRRVKSAMDIQHLVVNDHSPTSFTGSLIPIVRDRRPSITVDRSPPRPLLSRPYISHIPNNRLRRSSLFTEGRPIGRHKNFISFDHSDRKHQSLERASCSYHGQQQQPSISFEAAPPEPDAPSTTIVTVEVPRMPKLSRSFDHPVACSTNKPERMATSLDVSSFQLETEQPTPAESIQEEDRASPVFICLEDARLTAPLLEGLKSSDV